MAPEPAYIGWSASDDYPMGFFEFFCRRIFTTYYNKFSSNDWSAAKSVDTVCGIICIENEGDKLCQVTTQNTQKNLESKKEIEMIEEIFESSDRIWGYLVMVMDLFNREVIGYDISKKIDTQL